MEQVSVRYIVHDVDSALEFYVQQLGLTGVMHPAPGFALLSRGRQALLEDPSGNMVE